MKPMQGNQENILILKTGAAGDVVRTTCLLQYFQHVNVTWLTDAGCLCLFDSGSHKNLNVYPVNNFPPEILSTEYSLVLSLEEDEYCARLAGKLTTQKLTGVYWNTGFAYTSDAAEWFNMSLISVLGTSVSNEMKRNNTHSYQQHLFSMLRLPFNEERYTIFQPESNRRPFLIGIEKTAGHRWPNKTWTGYDAVVADLAQLGFQTIIFEKQNSLLQYMQAINNCSLLLCGDTLAMHLAIAYHIPVVALFNCTSPAEIFDYGLLVKLVSPVLSDFFYSTAYDEAAVSSIQASTVLDAVTAVWKSNYPMPNQTMVNGSTSGFQL